MADDASLPPLRIAIFGTPRCGNTWFRALLKTAFGLADYAEHDPNDIPWDSLPPRALVNLHATPDAAIRGRLAAHGFRSSVVTRHPLDALISILHFAPHHKASNGWLLGRGGTEDAIRGAAPTSPEFSGYATGPRAAALFSIADLWWNEPGTIRVRYEDLVTDTAGELSRVAAELGASAVRPIGEVVAEHAIENLRVRDRSYQHHMWKGRPGLWKHLIPPGLARAVAGAHPAVFAPQGYACDPDESLTEAQAHANWVSTLADSNDRDVTRLWDLVDAMRVAAEESRCRIADLEWRLSSALAGLAEQEARLLRADELIRETNIRADCLICENNIRIDGLLREANTRAAEAEGRHAEAAWRLEEARANVAALSERLRQADASIRELQGGGSTGSGDGRTKLEVYQARAAEAESRLSGIDPDTLRVALRLARLSVRFPRTARTAARAVRTVRKLRGAA